MTEYFQIFKSLLTEIFWVPDSNVLHNHFVLLLLNILDLAQLLWDYLLLPQAINDCILQMSLKLSEKFHYFPVFKNTFFFNEECDVFTNSSYFLLKKHFHFFFYPCFKCQKKK